jgi:gamma-glutamyltranspeptidase / glutathione hydrolase
MSKAQGAVTASTTEAAAAGEQILRAGGNAVDAAVAAALASCVADPCNTGIGGFGGHMLVAPAGEAPTCIDFNLWAPLSAAATYRHIVKRGPAASVIPNTVAGLSAALKTFGSMDWADVIKPAIALAENGFVAGKALRLALHEVSDDPFVGECFEIERCGGEDSALRIRQPALADTLRQLAANGPKWFYEGPVADVGRRCLTAAGHETTPAHWADALDAVTIGPAPSLRLGHLTVSSAPLGTSGSICMFATLAAGAALAADMDSPAGIRLWAERIAAAWAYRFATPDGNSIRDDMIADWIARAAAFKPAMTAAPGVGHTCHLNTVDKNGMVVAATMTHGMLWFGARWALPDTGVIMNFGGPMVCTPEPKHVAHRVYGVTNMAPTIARLDDGAVVAIGSPGARRIATIIGLVLARHVFGGAPLQDAIMQGRFHAEARDRATLEIDRLTRSVRAALQESFQIVEPEWPPDYYGPCTAIQRDAQGELTLGLDDRWPGFGAVLL